MSAFLSFVDMDKHPILTTEFLKSVARRPGVYQMLNKNRRIIYVGKARNLRKRLASYARTSARDIKTAALLSHVAAIETIITNTEKEALILEAALIKKHRPKYNVILRDDKNYPLIKVTVNEDWPRVLMTRRRIKDKARYFGPYSSAAAMWATIKLLHALFPLRRCKGGKLKNRERPCLNRQMGQCLAPCCGQADSGKYQEMVRNVILFLEGDKQGLIKKLRQQMAEAAEELRFEEAARRRDQLKALEKTLEKQIVVAEHNRDLDVIGFCRGDDFAGIAVLHVKAGRISGQRVFCFSKPPGDDDYILAQALVQYYGDQPLPGEVLLPFPPADYELLAERFAELKQKRVILHVGRRGTPRKLLDMAAKNSAQAVEERFRKKKSWQDISKGLKDVLRLEKAPEVIECLDISNIGGRQAVGALVSFRGGAKDSANYRHYKIRTLSGPDDYGMMAEVLERRLRRGREEDNLPDLFMVDGGKGQLNVAVKVLVDLELSGRVELLGIAKERKEAGEKLYRPGRKNPINLPRNSPVLLFLMRVRDESHRYGITFHRNWRRRENLSSGLDNIPGVGEGRRRVLLRHLGSFARISQASEVQLAEAPGIGQALARKIWAYLHDEGE